MNSENVFHSINKNPYYNLALEEYLMESVSPGENILLFYVNDDSVIIGRNQNPWQESDVNLLKKDKIPIARRISGGGTVFHDQGNLNYSMIIDKTVYDKSRQFELLLKSLKKNGINACVNSKHDLIINEKKFSGNAFCFRKNHVLHHGTIMFSVDTEKMKKYLTHDEKCKLNTKAIKSVRSNVINLNTCSNSIKMEDVRDSLTGFFLENYAIKNKEIKPLIIDESIVNATADKFCSWDWIYGESPSFVTELNRCFSWGTLSVSYKINKTKITEIDIKSDKLTDKMINYIKDLFSNTDVNQIKYIDSSCLFLNDSQEIYIKDIIRMLEDSLVTDKK